MGPVGPVDASDYEKDALRDMAARNDGSPLSPHAELDGDIVDYHRYRGRVTDRDLNNQTRPVIQIADRLAARAAIVTERDAALGALLAGRDGLQSERFLQRVRAANPTRLILRRRPELDPEPEPFDVRRAA